ncbi:response regulator, partial [Pseudomonas fluorescens]
RGSSGAWRQHQFNGELVSGFVGANPITDFMMPVMDGLEFATSVRALPSANDLPIILMSGAQAHIGMQRSDLFDAVLAKPFNIDLIIAEVRKLLGSE